MSERPTHYLFTTGDGGTVIVTPLREVGFRARITAAEADQYAATGKAHGYHVIDQRKGGDNV